MSVKVAVRVRPFSDRELGKNCQKCVIEMDGPKTIIQDPVTGQKRPFTFDYSFWSHDGYEEPPSGSGPLVAKTDEHGNKSDYADQELVYQTLGKQVLDNAWEGYHCCLFAYG